MSEINCNLDTSQWDALVAGLNYKEIRKCYRAALRQSGNVIKRAVWANIQSGLSESPRHLNATDDVKVNIFSRLGGYAVKLPVRRISKTHAVSARWIMTGTVQRATNNGYNRGLIAARPLFKQAVESSVNEAVTKITDALDRQFRRAGDKARQAGPKV